ncbi:MAG: SprT family zinc-dependent metalloprotease [Thermodesulfobacteriaceae bacterium]|nr:SprT family zinc-dependent metalloprotease [Thermodesulfobacteriaceae bacterium]
MEIKIEKIIRTKRKTIALQITDDATLIVRAPFEVSDEVIMRVVSKHLNWIKQKIKEVKGRDPKVVSKEFVSGESFPYLGQYYRLEIVDDQKEPLIFENKFYLAKWAKFMAREVFIDWYKKMAYEKISERVEWYTSLSGLKYNKITITNAQKRWGSCSEKGNLNFSWRLIMAPLPVIDYVVVHELAHLEIKNHSKRFWNRVKILMPDYEKHKEWLKRNGYLLRL